MQRSARSWDYLTSQSNSNTFPWIWLVEYLHLSSRILELFLFGIPLWKGWFSGNSPHFGWTVLFNTFRCNAKGGNTQTHRSIYPFTFYCITLNGDLWANAFQKNEPIKNTSHCEWQSQWISAEQMQFMRWICLTIWVFCSVLQSCATILYVRKYLNATHIKHQRSYITQ